MRKRFLLLIFALLTISFTSWGQTPYALTGGNYTEDFINIANTTNWPNGFNGTDCAEWKSVAVYATGTAGDGTKISTATATFASSSSGGVQRGTNNIMMLSTSTTNSCAIDLLLNFTGTEAGTISFDVATVFNGAGNRNSILKLFYSIDGTTFTELTGTNLPYTATNNVANSASITSIALPASFNNCATAVLRFYEYSTTGFVGASGSGAQPKISIDNISITSIIDIIAPVATFEPTNSTTNVLVNKIPTITFNETIRKIDGTPLVDADLATLITFKLTDATGTIVPSTATIDATKKKITITPNSTLSSSQLYYIAINPIEDGVGNESLLQSATFTTSTSNHWIGNTTSPILAQKFYAGNNATLNWTSGNIANVKVEVYAPDIAGSYSWTELTASVANTNTYSYSIPAAAYWGTEYKLRITDVDNAAVNVESPSFTVAAVTNNLTTLKSHRNGSVVKYTGKATVTYARTTNNQKYIQDVNSAVLIYDVTTAPGYITDTYNIGDGITNIEGTITLFNGLVQLVPTATTGTKILDGSNPVITPEVRTEASITTADQSKLIKINSLQISNFYSGNFISGKTYKTISSNSTFAVRANFPEADYISTPTPIPTTSITVIGLVGYYTGSLPNLYVMPRFKNDIPSQTAAITSTPYTVDGVGETITNVPFGCTLATLKSNLTASSNGTFEVYLADGTTIATDLATGYKVIVTAQDGVTKKTYVITINAAKTGKDILTFSFTEQTSAAVLGAGTIAVTVASSSTITTLVATFTLSDGATVKIGATSQVSATTANDFTNAVTYVVTAEDGTTKNWVVTVTKSVTLNTATDFTAFSVPSGSTAVIDAVNHTITTELPYGSSRSALIATFTLSAGATVKVGATAQVSATTANDFASAVTYTITAEDGTTVQPWTVTVSVNAGSSDATVTSSAYTVDGTAGTIVNIPYNETLANFKTKLTPAALAAFEVYNADGTTVATNIASGYKVIVTSQNGTKKTYVITLITAPAMDLFISEYNEPASGNNKILELFNPTNSPIDLSQYTLKQSYNGGGYGIKASLADPFYVLPLSGTLDPKKTYVICPDNASADILAIANLKLTYGVSTGGNVASFTGNDAIALFKGTTIIDVIGIEISTEANGFNVAGVTTATKDHNMRRKESIIAGNSNWTAASGTDAGSSEWIVGDPTDVTNIGKHGPPVPTAIASATSLTFISTVINTNSAEQTFTVSGTDLTANIVIKVPAGFEMSLTTATGFASTDITLTQTAGSVANTTIYVRFKPTAAQAYTGNISINSTGATEKLIALSGTGVSTADVTPPVFTTGYPKTVNVQNTVFDVLVNLDEASKVFYLKKLAADAAPAVADVIAGGTFVDAVAASTDYTIAFTGLTENTDYAIYLVAQDKQGTPNVQATATKLPVKTGTLTQTIKAIQFTTDASGVSPLLASKVKVTGNVTSVYKGLSSGAVFSLYFLTDNSSTDGWNGIAVYETKNQTVNVGDEVTVEGIVAEVDGMTTISTISAFTTVSTGKTITATTVTCANAAQEKYEGMLLSIANAKCTVANDANNVFSVSDASGVIKVVPFLLPIGSTFAAAVDKVYNLTGIGYYSTANGFGIAPRNNTLDIVVVTAIHDLMEAGISLYPNPASNMLYISNAKDVKRVTIQNLSGQTVREVINSAERIEIGIENLPAGMYMIKLESNQKAYSGKFIKY